LSLEQINSHYSDQPSIDTLVVDNPMVQEIGQAADDASLTDNLNQSNSLSANTLAHLLLENLDILLVHVVLEMHAQQDIVNPLISIPTSPTNLSSSVNQPQGQFDDIPIGPYANLRPPNSVQLFPPINISLG